MAKKRKSSRTSAGPTAITITVDPETRDMTVTPTSCHLQDGGSVVWRVPFAESFVLTFADGSPLGRAEVRGTERLEEVVGDEKRPVLASGLVRVQEAPGVYHYAVAISIDGQVYVDAGCPTIIIGH
jgi:hypothetical protein